MEKWIPFNLNNDVRVKLNDKGYQRLADFHNQYLGVIPKWEKRTPEYFKQRADKDGYTQFHMWEFMEEFGEVTGMGRDMRYDVNILIRDNGTL